MTNNDTNYAPHCPKMPWMVDFYSTGVEARVAKCQQAAVYADTYRQYAMQLNIDSALYPKRLTGIVCTVGPRSSDVETLEKLMEEGMTIARIKSVSYSRQEDCRDVISNIRRACNEHSKKIGRVYSLAIALDVQGPEICTGVLPNITGSDEIELVAGNTVSVTSDIAYEEHVTKDMIYVDYQHIEQVVVPGDHLHLNDGAVTLSAREIVGSVIRCIIEKTGKLVSKASVSLEGVPVHTVPISERDSKDLLFCVSEQLDIVMLSCVKDGAMVRQARHILGDEGKAVALVAKVENGQGFANVDEIIAEADGVLINRSKLALELPQEKLFLVQKNIIAKCNEAGKPVICAPTLLESMATNPRPTRAELLDVSNAILEGADCLLLSRETTHGDYAVETVRTLAVLCREAEAAVYHQQAQQPRRANRDLWPVNPIYGIAAAIAEAAVRCQAAAIVMTTTTGRAAQVVASCRPRCPIVAVTRFGAVARHLRMWRGIEPLHYVRPPLTTTTTTVTADWLKDVEKRIQYGITYGKMSGFIAPGDCIIAARSARPGAGFVNTMFIYYASEFDVVPPPTAVTGDDDDNKQTAHA